MKTMQALLIICVTLMLAPLAHAQKYHAFVWNSGSGLTDLGTLGGDTSYALGVNDSGEVVGYSYLADNVTTHVFTWTSSGGLVDLGSLSGGTWTQGSAINSAGDIAGTGLDSNRKQVPTYWSPSGGMVSLGENVGDTRNYGFGINDAGAVTGQIYVGAVVHAYYWLPGYTKPRFIGALPGGLHSVGCDINNLQHITGTAGTSFGRFDAFIWNAPSGMIDIGSLPGGSYTSGRGINDNDEVVGFGGLPNAAFYWKRGVGMVTLQTLAGGATLAMSINNSGAIAGWSDSASGADHAVKWDSYTSAPQDLGTLPGGTISYAYGINASGQVAGFSDVP